MFVWLANVVPEGRDCLMIYRLSGYLQRFNRSSDSLCRCEQEPGGRTERMKEERRLVWRVPRHWKEIADSGRFPRRDAK